MGDRLYQAAAHADDVLYRSYQRRICLLDRRSLVVYAGSGHDRIFTQSGILYHHYADHFRDAHTNYVPERKRYDRGRCFTAD